MVWKHELVSALKRAKNGEKACVIESYMRMTGLSSQSLYRIARDNGYNAGRIPRRDTGNCRINLDQAKFIAGLMEETKREIKGHIMPVGVALEIAEMRGVIDPGSVSEDHMRAILRRHGLDKKTVSAPQPRIMMRSLYPNHVHVFDASICIQYYLKNGRMGIMDERNFYKNKPENFARQKEHIIRYVLTDHCSHTIFVKYYLAAGENSQTVFDFLISAWEKKADSRFPFRGVPEYLLMDAGSANICKPMMHFIRGLGIRTPESMPHNPSRQGSAEVAQNIVETHFECRLGIQPAHSIEELNEWVLDWCINYNATKIHTRHGLTRTQCWLTIGTPVELPERGLLNALFVSPSETRKITPQYTISYRPQGKDYESMLYSLRHLPDIAPNAAVTVMMRPLIWPEIGVIWRDNEYLIKPLDIRNAGFASEAAVIGDEYKAVAYSPAQRFQSESHNMAYGESGKKGRDAAFPGAPIMGNLAERVTHDFIPRRDVPHPIMVDREGIVNRLIPITELFKRMLAAGGPISPEINRRVREAYGSSISSSEADRLVAEYEETGSVTVETPAPLAATGGGAC